MKTEVAKKILELDNDVLVEVWKKTNAKEYYDLKKTRTDEEICECIKEIARNVLNKESTTFHLKNGKKQIDYFGE